MSAETGCEDKSFVTVHVFHMQMFWLLFILEGWKKIFDIYLIWMYYQIRCISFWSQIAILLYHVIKMAHFILRTIQWYMLTFVCMMYYQKEIHLIKYKLLKRNVKFFLMWSFYMSIWTFHTHTHTHIYEFPNFHLNLSSQLNYHTFYHNILGFLKILQKYILVLLIKHPCLDYFEWNFTWFTMCILCLIS